MLDTTLKNYKNKLLDIIYPANLTQINPSVYSILGILLFIPVFLLITKGKFILATFIFALSRIFDGLDGYVALTSGKASPAGEIIDQTIDLVIYSLFMIALAVERSETGYFIITMVILSIYYVNMYINSIYSQYFYMLQGLNNETDPEIGQKEPLIAGTETLIFYALFLLLHSYLQIIIILFIFLLTTGMFRQCYYIFKITEKFE